MSEPDAGAEGGPRTDGGRARRSKVQRVIDEYGLSGLGDELEERWTGARGQQDSLRTLADVFNRRVLRAAMEEAGMNPLDGEVENMYRLLTSDDVSRGMETQARESLEREGLDTEGLEADFVSHQAIHTYLTKYRGVERASEEGDQVEKGRGAIQRLKSRVRAVTEKNLTTFRDTGKISLGSFEVLVDVRVFCEDCGRQYDVIDLLDRGGCECEDAD